MTYTLQEKTDILKELISMAYVDQHLKREEVEFVKVVGKRLGVGEEDLSEMLEQASTGTPKPPKEFIKRILHFHRIMLMMRIDGDVDEKELQLLHEVALRYGIRRFTVLSLLEVMDKYPHGNIPPSELLAIHTQSSN
ncbi:tellurite resistance TerB family protein [Nonlabens marinus]|uniref:Co-chaperone DjlA N-terminal domain-containing protein n=1 Tax=Nonlabens marinus S1-08 TaxID=1454201 RepID=W8VWR3_9FLAO|nr:TerB family tellurite resistance protein [Nonlabens marinus]BAO56558.1 hypothetical protein NMS_2549 [Nonlabens marinus S1-08]